MSEELEGYVTVNAAARRIGRSTEQVRRYLREGRLAGRRIGGQWFIREAALLYRTQKSEMNEMIKSESSPAEDLPGITTRARLEVFERINRRREDIRQRWERLGISMDAAELVQEIRDEAP